ncbi:hypothetical protein KLEB273_gp239 [Bacillus phage vB_BauM_KLEB27-3]|nr:hypothetical protein KLEB273_gp239 [Bacillus phage vB_BauM_KLEB27-3]
MDKAFDKVTDYIDRIAVKLGVAGEHVYDVLIEQAYYGGIINLSGGIFLTLFAIALSFFLWKVHLSSYGSLHDVKKIGDGALYAALHVVTFFLYLFGLIFIFLSIGPIINPEYFAIRDLIEMLTNK